MNEYKYYTIIGINMSLKYGHYCFTNSLERTEKCNIIMIDLHCGWISFAGVQLQLMKQEQSFPVYCEFFETTVRFIFLYVDINCIPQMLLIFCITDFTRSFVILLFQEQIEYRLL